MPRFFLQDVCGEHVRIEGEDAKHIARSLRMQEGEELTLCNMQGTDYRCVIQGFTADGCVELQVLEQMQSTSEVPCKLRLYQALPKGDKLEFIIQKATELGVDEIIPVITARCISRPHVKSMEKKRQRLQKIAYEAAKQSGRGKIPQIMPMTDFEQAVEEMRQAELPILFYENSSLPLRQVLEGQPGSISIMVGSEGGFSQREVEQAQAAGVQTASLGSRILRCETAPMCALSAILYFLGEF